ncbi:MAG: beta strand repeat-containing protein, partial [Planctomycetota bacterium]
EISWNALDTTGNASMGISVGDAGASGLNINNNTFAADGFDGSIWGPLVSGATVSDNTFSSSSGTGYAVQFSGLTDSTISQNEITDYGQGISVFHGEGVSNVLIEKNEITGCTNGIRFGEYKATAGPDGDITSVTVRNNKVTGGDTGIRLHPDGAHVLANEIHVYENDLSGNTYGAKNELTNGTVLDAEGNWWGAADGPTHWSNPGGSGVDISDNVDYSPWLGIGADSDPAIGFQMASPMDWWSNDYIQDAIDAASPGDSVCVPAKTYSETVNVNKGLAGLNFMGAASSEIDGEVTLTNDSDNWDGGVLGINTENENLTLNPVTDTGSHGLTLDAGTAIIGLDGDVTIGEDLTLLSDTVVAADKTLFSFAGHVILAPDEAITGQGALTIRADEDILLGVGDPLSPETGSPGNVTANGNLTLDAGDSIYAHGTLTTQDGSVGHINLSASDSTIHLFGNVTADVTDGGDIFVHNRSEVAAGVTLQAGHDVTIDALMTGLGDLTIEAGAQPGDVDGQVQAVGISMPATTSTLSLTQTPSLDMAGFPIVFNSDTTNLDATSNAGSVTEKAADRWLSIAADADTFISLDDSDAGGDITTGDLTANSGDILIKSDLGKVNVDGPINAGMDVKIAGNEGPDGLDDAIFLNYSDPGPTVQAGRDIWLASNTRAAGGVALEAGQDVRVGWQGDQGPFDDRPGQYESKTLTGDGSLFIFADRHITLGGPVEAAGDLLLIADNDLSGLHPSTDVGGNLWAMKSLTTTNGGVILGHGENIQVDGIVDSAGPLLMYALDNITLNDDAEADAGMQLYADWDSTWIWDFEDGVGNLSTKNLTTYGGEIDAKGHNIGIDGAIDSSSNVKLFANDDVTVTGNIDAGGTIDIWSDDTTTYLGGDWVEAVGNITLHDNTVLNGGDQRIDSLTGLLITDDGANVDKSTAGNVNFGGDDGIELGGNVTGSGMTAGNTMTFEDDVTAYGTSAQEIDADAGKLVTIDGVNIDKLSDTTLTLGGGAGIELGGNVTGSGLTAASSIIMEDDVTANGTGGQRFDADDGKLVTENAVDIDKTTPGNLNLGGGAGIELGGDVEGTGLTEFDAITFEDDVTADGTDAAADQRLEAYAGSLVTQNAVDIDKTTSGRLFLGGNEGIELGGNVTGTGI